MYIGHTAQLNRDGRFNEKLPFITSYELNVGFFLGAISIFVTIGFHFQSSTIEFLSPTLIGLGHGYSLEELSWYYIKR